MRGIDAGMKVAALIPSYVEAFAVSLLDLEAALVEEFTSHHEVEVPTARGVVRFIPGDGLWFVQNDACKLHHASLDARLAFVGEPLYKLVRELRIKDDALLHAVAHATQRVRAVIAGMFEKKSAASTDA